MKYKNKRVVLLDMGGTLIDPFPSVGHIYAEEARRFGMDLDAEQTNQLFARSFRLRENEAGTISEGTERQWWYELVREVVGGLCPLRSFDAFFDQVYERFAHPQAWQMYPDVMPFLDILGQRGIRAAVVSNWDSRLVALCDRLGLTPRMACIMVSALVGSAKPDPTIFRRALDALGVDAGEALHIGDSIDKDIGGARNAGIDALLIDRAGRRDATWGGRTVRSLVEIPALLEPL